MKFRMLLFAGTLCLSVHAYSQLGINTPTPSSTLDVRGSIEGNYREFTTTTDFLYSNDYHLSFAGISNSILNLPSQSTTDGSAADFRGRKYYIKNNSTSSVLTLAAATGQIIRSGGMLNANSNTVVLQPGKLAVLTAGEAKGWDIQEIKWGLFDVITNGPGTTAQNIPGGGNYYTLTDSPLTVTVPASGAKVLLKFTGYGIVTGTANSFGTVRLRLLQTIGAATTTYDLACAQSWYNRSSGGTTAYDFKADYNLANLVPGTYTFSLQILREAETGSVTSFIVSKSIGRGDVFVK
ncbi:hypothetical protein [Chryseobacterium culicis]|uniref:Uncharacterized protein n=1 Tax=Chryseobacterium culicis TaxID=680127 RepID=A0A1H6HH87_CHRCI|nr:hypothetical protein [Chryseobacterium culicis]SEH33635.1 hypothetical protein SAMN05421593_2392 [Chryseobacterium culicis]